MTTIAVSCKRCGASLEVPEETRFLVCTACSSLLEIILNGTAAYTEIVAARDAETVMLELELDELDRQWRVERAPYFANESLDGSFVVNTRRRRFEAVLGTSVGTFFIGVGLWAEFQGMTGEGLFLIFGGITIIGWVAARLRKAKAYRTAQQTYCHRREQLLSDIAASRGKAYLERDNRRSVN